MPYRKVPMFFLVGLVLVSGGWLVYQLGQPRPLPLITRESFNKLKHGMTRADVEAIMQGPPGDYGGGYRKYGICSCQGCTCSILYDWRHERKDHTAEEIDAIAAREGIVIWWGRDDAIAVQLSEDGKVISLGYGRAFREPSFWESIWNSIENWVE